MFDNYLSKACRVFRYFLAGIGAIVSIGFIAYGTLLRVNDSDNNSLEDDVILVFGAFVFVLSCTVAGVVHVGDRQMRKMLNALRAHTDRLQETNDNLGEKVHSLESLQVEYATTAERLRKIIASTSAKHQQHLDNFRAENDRLSEETEHVQAQVDKLHVENEELRDTCKRLEHLSNEYHTSLHRLREQNACVKRELDEMRELNAESNDRVEQLESLAAQQRERIDELTRQAANLNELQRKSVKMIQMLSMYGDECRTMGISLKDTARELRNTDESLGLTSAEMSTQLRALKLITSQLKDAASKQSVDVSEQLSRMSSDDDDDSEQV